MTKHILIFDAHIHKDTPFSRFHALSRLITKEMPDTIVFGGDWWDLPSLSWFDKGKPHFQATSYKEDIRRGRVAMDITLDGINRRKQTRCHRLFLIGNHEYRIQRAIDSQGSPVNLRGLLSFNHLLLDKHHMQVVPYKGIEPGYISVDGILYSHFFKDRNSLHLANTLLLDNHQSSVQGHTHQLDYKVVGTPQGRSLHGLVCGCFTDEQPSYSGQTSGRWSPGVAILHDVQDGSYDLEWVSLDRLMSNYG